MTAAPLTILDVIPTYTLNTGSGNVCSIYIIHNFNPEPEVSPHISQSVTSTWC